VVVVCKSHYCEIVQDSGGEFNNGGNENGGVGGKKGYAYSSFCDFLVEFLR
jgi:hypothetical protein